MIMITLQTDIDIITAICHYIYEFSMILPTAGFANNVLLHGFHPTKKTICKN